MSRNIKHHINLTANHMKKIKINKPDVVEHLVTNALAFVERGVDALDKDEVISAICFSTAMELLLKARLAAEHWSLIFKDPDKASMDKFRDGDFQSATLENTITRLKNITDTEFDSSERNAYTEISKHRNICVHFGADGKFKNGSPATINKALVYLHKKITEEWNALFFNNKADVQKLHHQISRLGPFIDEKYQLIKDTLRETAEREGLDIIECIFCQKESCLETSGVSDEKISITRYHCKICGHRSTSIEITCPECKELAALDEGEAICECGNTISQDDIVGWYETSHQGDESTVYLCASCESYEPSVINVHDTFICLSCYDEFDRIGYCEWCHEGIGGIAEETYLGGCHMCEGWIGHNADKD